MTTTNTVKIFLSNHDKGGANIGPLIRPVNDYERTVKLMKSCGYEVRIAK